jgi:hypothetical protein
VVGAAASRRDEQERAKAETINASAKISLNLSVFGLDKKCRRFPARLTKGIAGWRRDFSLEGERENPACGLNTFTRGAQKAAK